MSPNWASPKQCTNMRSTSYSPLQKDGQLGETSSLNISPITNCCSRERFVSLRPRISGQPMPDHHTRPGQTAIMQIFRCYHPQGKHLFLKSCFPHLVTTADTGGVRDINIYGFSAEFYTGLAVHEILSDFAAFPGRLCVWKPDSLTEFNYQVVLIEWHPTWSGRAKHSYGHLLFIDLDEGVHEVQRLQITTPHVIPHRGSVRRIAASTLMGWL